MSGLPPEDAVLRAKYWRREAQMSAEDGHPEAALAAMARAYEHDPPADPDASLLAYARALGLHDWRPTPPDCAV